MSHCGNENMLKWYNSPWVTEVHVVFEEAELQQAYMCRNNSSCSMNIIRRKLIARYEENWPKDISLNPKL